MKKLIFLLVLTIGLFAANIADAQVYKLKSTSVCYNFASNSNWEGWSAFEPTSVLIAFLAENDRIKVFSKEEQTLDIIEYQGVITDNEGDEFMTWRCIDQNGKRCRVRLATLHTQNKRTQVYIEYSDFKVCYDVDFLK